MFRGHGQLLGGRIAARDRNGDAEINERSPPEPVTAATPAREFQLGDTVTFENSDGRGVNSVIAHIKQRTATVGTGRGGIWRGPFHMLRHALDI